MTRQDKLLAIWLAAASILLVSDDISRLESMAPAPPLSSEAECALLARKVTIAKAHEEMRRYRAPHPDTILVNVQQAFADSDIIKSEYTRRRGCVVTVKLPIERLRLIAGKM